jgi:hypothetical protein
MAHRVYSMTKAQLALLLGVSGKTVGKYLNVLYYEQMKQLGYYKRQKILMPKQIEFLIGHLDIDVSDIYQKN